MSSFNIWANFGIETVTAKEIKTGIINDTFVVTDKNGKKYILQEINSTVFKNVDGLMNNIEKVTNYLKEKITQEGGDAKRETLTLIKNINTDKPYLKIKDDNGCEHFFRMYEYIDNASTYDEASEQYLFEAGKGFGKFQRQLDGFDASELIESIPNFHNTRKRLEAFLSSLDNAYKQKDSDYISDAYSCIKYALKHADISNIIMDALETGKIPTRVVHNDTKLNNVMLDNNNNQALCVIDLDTIMPGTMLFDYGDAIRSGANAGLEDDVNLKNVYLDKSKFEAYTKGFVSEIATIMTPEELKMLAQAPIVLTYELGLRFLTDYLDGNKYFKCDLTRPKHNLERAKAQFTLTQDLIKNYSYMNQFTNEIYNEYKLDSSKQR